MASAGCRGLYCGLSTGQGSGSGSTFSTNLVTGGSGGSGGEGGIAAFRGEQAAQPDVLGRVHCLMKQRPGQHIGHMPLQQKEVLLHMQQVSIVQQFCVHIRKQP